MNLATDKYGDVLVNFVPLINGEAPGPVGFSVIVLKHNEKTVLVYNRYKKHWEVPGGHREKDETPLQCVLREIKEETGQIPAAVHAAGIIGIQSTGKGKVVHGMLFSGTLQTLLPFEENDEIAQICYWNGRDDIGYINEIDRKLVELASD